jgi:hypothetical protein
MIYQKARDIFQDKRIEVKIHIKTRRMIRRTPAPALVALHGGKPKNRFKSKNPSKRIILGLLEAKVR